jgi:hypothetical protein
VSDEEDQIRERKLQGRYRKRASGNVPLEQVASERAKAL